MVSAAVLQEGQSPVLLGLPARLAWPGLGHRGLHGLQQVWGLGEGCRHHE